MKKVALVTGSSRRIGAAIATILHDNDYNIVLHYKQSAVDAKKTCTLLNSRRENSAIICQADLNHIEELNSILNTIENGWGRLDVLVNNASSFYQTTIGKVTENAWDDLFGSNVKGAFFLSQLVAPLLIRQQGCIINIADIHGEKPLKNYPVYCMAKASLIMMTKVLARELAPHVRVNAVSPGSIAWPEGDASIDEATKQMIIERTALKKAGEPKDIAKSVLFLASDAAYITGQTVVVDGGRSIY